MAKVTGLSTVDLRFNTFKHLDDSNAINPDPHYSATYAILGSDIGPSGRFLTFTIGCGNDICIAAIKTMSHLVIGLHPDKAHDWPLQHLGNIT